MQICAKLVVDAENAVDSAGNLLPESELAARFDAAIKEINKTMPRYKIIRYFVMTMEELVKANGIKTKRHIEQEKVRRMLDEAGVEIRKVSGRFIENLKDRTVRTVLSRGRFFDMSGTVYQRTVLLTCHGDVS